MSNHTPNIVAGSFEDQAQADHAIEALVAAGFATDAVTTFVLNAPGQHHNLPLGGDKAADDVAAGGEKGAIKGAAIGTGVGIGVGVAATPLVGPIGVAAGAATGAWLGAMAGALNHLGANADSGAKAHERPAGVMVAAHAPSAAEQERALQLLVAHGARGIETASGHWADGQWIDFDPVAPPEPVNQVHPLSGRGR